MIIGIALASEIAAVLSLLFVGITSPHSLGESQPIFLIDAPPMGLLDVQQMVAHPLDSPHLAQLTMALLRCLMLEAVSLPQMPGNFT